MEKGNSLEKAQKAYANANDQERKLLEGIFGPSVVVKPLRETIKGIADVIRQSGKSATAFKMNAKTPIKKKAAIQLELIETIFEVFREGKKVNTGDTKQQKWYPYFKVVQDDKAPAGFRLAFNAAVCDIDYAILGARPKFVVFTQADAAFIGKTFTDEFTKLFQYENLAQ